MIECGKNGGLLFRVLLFRFVSERCGAADEALAWNSYSQCGAVCDAAWGQCRFLVMHMDVRGLRLRCAAFRHPGGHPGHHSCFLV